MPSAPLFPIYNAPSGRICDYHTQGLPKFALEDNLYLISEAVIRSFLVLNLDQKQKLNNSRYLTNTKSKQQKTDQQLRLGNPGVTSVVTKNSTYRVLLANNFLIGLKRQVDMFLKLIYGKFG